MASVARYCCCGCTESASACTNCDDITPTQYTVVFSGTNICDSCDLDEVGSEYFEGSYINSFLLNSSHVLDQTATPCFWQKDYSASYVYKFTSYAGDSTCTTVSYTTDFNIRIELTRTATEWTLQAVVYRTGIGVVGRLFSGTVAANTSGGGDQLCATVPVVSNGYTAGQCGDNDGGNRKFATGGSATITCV